MVSTVAMVTSVPELRAPTRHVGLQLLAYGVVDRRRLVVLQRLLVDLTRTGGRVLGTVAHPALVVLRRGEHRPVEAGTEPLHGVLGAQEVSAVADLLVGIERHGR